MTTMTNTTLYFTRQQGEPAPSGQVRLSAKRRKPRRKEDVLAVWTFFIPPAALERLTRIDDDTFEGDWAEMTDSLTFEVETK